jgi:peptide-methionine (S)-S-oxide reductase
MGDMGIAIGGGFVRAIHLVVILLMSLMVMSCSPALSAAPATPLPVPAKDLPAPKPDEHSRTAVLAGGCFWCVEAVFDSVKGVDKCVSGYAGGTKETANYEHYSESNHAEAVKITYDPHVITYAKLLQILFTVSEPTVKDKQGPDAGHQYRMAVFYENDAQKAVAEAYIKQLTDAHVFDEPIETTVEPMPEGFFPAEEYHQQFVKKNPDHPYVQSVSIPKLKKLREAFPNLIKPGSVAAKAK